MSLRLTDFIGNAGQTNFFMEHNTTESSEDIYCLFNVEYGMHSTQEMSITKKQVQTALLTQHNAYKNYIGKTYGSFVCEAIEYDWGLHEQIWTVRCLFCGEVTQKHNGYQWSRGKLNSRKCHCEKKRREQEKQIKQQKRTEERITKEQERQLRIDEQVGKTYGKFKIIEYAGYDSCKVVCTECGAERRTGVTITKLQNGEYPSCMCGKADYGNKRWIGTRVGHLTVMSHEGHNFICKCDCGRERVCTDSYFAQKRYRDCGSRECDYIEESRANAIAARNRGYAYEQIVCALLKSNGYKAKHVGGKGRDFGVDIIATDPEGIKIAVQCKSNMASTTTLDAVQQVYAGGRYYGLEHFAVVSHSGYSVTAVKMAKKLGVYLSDGQTFIYPDDIKEYASSLLPVVDVHKNLKAQKLYEMNGVKKTLVNWAFEYNANYAYVLKGIRMGLSLENALKYKPYNNYKRYTVRGFYGTLSEIYSHFKPNISEETIRQRLKKGMDIETAVFMPAQVQGRPRK